MAYKDRDFERMKGPGIPPFMRRAMTAVDAVVSLSSSSLSRSSSSTSESSVSSESA